MMTLQQMRVAAAEWMGWKFVPSRDVMGGVLGLTRMAIPEQWVNDDADDVCLSTAELPPYDTSIDACRTLEVKLDGIQWLKYIENLKLVVWGSPITALCDLRMIFLATAPQRLEAWARTVPPESFQ